MTETVLFMGKKIDRLAEVAGREFRAAGEVWHLWIDGICIWARFPEMA